MRLDEFDIIKQFFAKRGKSRPDVLLGIGDDAALLRVSPQCDLVATMDTLVSGIHFPENTLPADIGYKALAVNLSDLAAMGAEPAWAMLALTLPHADPDWLTQFCDGFFELIDRFELQLIGGDITRGPLSITVQAQGFVPSGQALRRDGAKQGDHIYITGSLGDAGFALRLLKQQQPNDKLMQRLNRPMPRIAEGLALRGIANSAIDISDGLVADLSHILERSGVGATVYVDDLPLSTELSTQLALPDAWQLSLTAGDDYELCFTAPPALLTQLKDHYYCIGVIEASPGLRLLRRDGQVFVIDSSGFKHF